MGPQVDRFALAPRQFGHQFTQPRMEVVPFGDLEGPGLRDVTIGSDGTVYVVDSFRDVVHRLDPDADYCKYCGGSL